MSLSAASENFGFEALANSLAEENNTHKNKLYSSLSYEHIGLKKHAYIHKFEYDFPAKHWR